MLGDLKESFQFRVRGEDYETATRSITLVPPPMISSLLRDEFRPAYLYHRPPLTDGDEIRLGTATLVFRTSPPLGQTETVSQPADDPAST